MAKLDGQHLAILGAGKSGLGAARLARKLGASVTIFDDGQQDLEQQQKVSRNFAAEGFEVRFGLEAAREACQTTPYSLVVISPGLDAGWPLPKIFTDAGIPLIGEMEFAWCELKHIPMIAITGTNGKTTTTELMERILLGCGKKTVACGNYGLALSEVALSGEPCDVLTVEVSSFQLETIQEFRPRVALWLNFAPDHLDRYPDNESYFEAKRRIFDYMESTDAAILRDGELAKLGELAPQVWTFSAEKQAGESVDLVLRDGELILRGEKVGSLEDLPLKERHNIENQMAALLAGLQLGLTMPEMLHALNGYAAARHRCELVRVFQGRAYINDSKATNLHALETCLRSQDEPVILIAGGKEKGLNYQLLTDLLGSKVSGLVLIGEIAQALYQQFHQLVPCLIAADVPSAVREATAMAAPGQSIVFSPGTSSFDMFSGYVERGNVFCEAVHALQDEEKK